MINLPNIDSKIWDIELRTVDIIANLLQAGRISVRVDDEGPDLRSNKLYELLDYVCSTLGIEEKQEIKITTRNLLEEHDSYHVEVIPPYTFVERCQQYVENSVIPSKNFTSINHYGILVGRSNWQRLWLGSHLYSNYANKTTITYHYNHLDDYHGANLGLDTLIYEAGAAILPQINKLLAASPLLYDKIDGYPVDGRKLTVPSLDISQLYGKFFAEIVCETYNNGQTFFPTEKTWRPIMCKTPFIIQGPQNFLANLKALGIKTFGNWWDESYDCQPGRTKIEEIIKIIDMLARKSELELEAMYNEMMPTLEHNYNVMMNLTPEQMLAAKYVK